MDSPQISLMAIFSHFTVKIISLLFFITGNYNLNFVCYVSHFFNFWKLYRQSQVLCFFSQIPKMVEDCATNLKSVVLRAKGRNLLMGCCSI